MVPNLVRGTCKKEEEEMVLNLVGELVNWAQTFWTRMLLDLCFLLSFASLFQTYHSCVKCISSRFVSYLSHGYQPEKLFLMWYNHKSQTLAWWWWWWWWWRRWPGWQCPPPLDATCRQFHCNCFLTSHCAWYPQRLTPSTVQCNSAM